MPRVVSVFPNVREVEFRSLLPAIMRVDVAPPRSSGPVAGAEELAVRVPGLICRSRCQPTCHLTNNSNRAKDENYADGHQIERTAC